MNKFKIMLLLFLPSFLQKAVAQDTEPPIYLNDTLIIEEEGNASFGDGTVTKLILGDSAVIINRGGGLYFFVDTVVNNGATFLNEGSVHFAYNKPQVFIGDSIFHTTNLVIENSSGVTMKQVFNVSNNVTFTNGIVSIPDSAAALEFDPDGGTAIAASGASDISHVKGYVRQLGTGAFVYPVGDSIHYQPIEADLSINSGGMRCDYQSGDAGNSAFVPTGIDATPLLHYNQLEYWNLSPAGPAEGMVTVYYDDNQNVGIGSDYATALKVAHKTAAGWQNEGGSVSGTATAGKVTTAGSVNSWSPFTLGSITGDSPLPVEIAGIAVAVKDCGIVMDWRTGTEKALAYFEVQYSTDGSSFAPLGKVDPRGTGSRYSFTTDIPAQGRCFLRLCSFNTDGTYSYSKVMTAELNCGGTGIVVYPNPVPQGGGFFVRLSGYKNKIEARLYDLAGRSVSHVTLKDGDNYIESGSLSAGNYMLEVSGPGYRRQLFKITIAK